ncbi:TetR/AcrR family transcriptional regulator [Ihubacter massiliensis]|uniref:TetR/AcrR family transcriptional regulator n=1 Tax=Hominibacterium faecale TaxID=2839743 RepID=A0A9J6QSQ5_9FIRM|nr:MULTISPECIES: TetR/AcrR family transcriptional regulator [Eubacteriales Family XIII. Incertae Sedis]MCI7301230.1 TetR/AcrR family transcriptional regulator [Clostridia bacterium]MDE8734057.1 TetR/AcrR family transcriptional regulator [Eubacteriales bacterium DFI.9.88]MDY3013106.1 TetR/AcrR family transcriptional regulator [Clostridiales Family XIII bacterium]MCO7121765.1 TetR/AcrR family transcriptional regulator [Ihubacter massiliensis]MCU7377691.1 TetR/AcrR family transcriptional regulato
MAESRRAANKIKCRTKILKASRRLFKANGFENTMIEDVAAKAEVSKATLYNYFPNKESLLVGTAEDETEVFFTYVEKELANEDADSKIRKALVFLVSDSIPFIGVSRRILYLNSCKTSPLYKKGEPVRQLFLQMIRQAQQEEIFRQDVEAEDILDLFMGVYLNSQFQWERMESYSKERCEEKINHILDLALTGIYR